MEIIIRAIGPDGTAPFRVRLDRATGRVSAIPLSSVVTGYGPDIMARGAAAALRRALRRGPDRQASPGAFRRVRIPPTPAGTFPPHRQGVFRYHLDSVST